MNPIPYPVTVVDDDAQVRRALGRVLKAHGCLAQEFASAEEFLSNYPKQTRCLVLDIDLGGISGIELYRTLLQRNGSAPPVVFITGKSSPAIENAVRTLGAIDFLAKPVDAIKLMAAVRRAASAGG